MYHVFVGLRGACFDGFALEFADLHWFCGKGNFIDGGVYMRFSGGIGSRITSSFFM